MSATACPRPCVIVTRPVGAGRGLLLQARARGAVALAVPGLSLKPPDDVDAARAALAAGLGADVVIFSSPATVRFAARLRPLRNSAAVVALGAATASALRRAGIVDVALPRRADSEGALALPPLQAVSGRRVTIVGAAGGRGLLRRALARRGARVALVHVYQRLPARLDQRHLRALRDLSSPPFVLLSSAAALAALQARLPDWAWATLTAGTAVTSSARLDAAAAHAGFGRRLRARSALASDLLACVPE